MIDPVVSQSGGEAGLQYSPGLGSALRQRHVTMIAMGGIIGAGLFVGSSTAIASAGPAVVVSYATAGIIILMIMRMLSELAANSNGAVSFTDLIRLGLGPLGGFVAGWLYWFFWVVVLAIEAIAAANIIGGWLEVDAALTAIVVLATLTVINLFSARVYGEAEFWLSSLKVIAIIAFIGGAMVFLFQEAGAANLPLKRFAQPRAFAPAGWSAVLAATTTVIFALCGAEIATIAAMESPDPKRVVTRMTFSIAFRIIVFYVLSIALIVAIVPWNIVVPGHSPFTTTLDHMGIRSAAIVMDVVVLVAVLSCLNSGLYVTSRVAFALSRQGDAPAWFANVNRRQVPVPAVLIGSAFGFAALAAGLLSPHLIFNFLINASGATMLILYAMVAASQLVHRYRILADSKASVVVPVWLFPWLSYLTISVILAIMAAMVFVREAALQLMVSLGVAAVVMLVGMATATRRVNARILPTD